MLNHPTPSSCPSCRPQHTRDVASAPSGNRCTPPRVHALKSVWKVFAVLLLVVVSGSQVEAQEALTNGGIHTGVISPAGDSDSWVFTAPAGGSVMLRVGGTNITPRIRLFGPSNELIAEETSGNTLIRDGALTTTTTNAGNYTVIVSATYTAQTGSYGLHLAVAPGTISVPGNDEGGPLASGADNLANLTLGDLDTWTFEAAAGESISIRMGSLTVTPWLHLYGPNGALVGQTTSGNTLARDGYLNVQATNAGPYTLVASAVYAGQVGAYNLHFVRAPGSFVVSPGDQGGELVNGAIQTGTLNLGDLDAWSLSAQSGEELFIRMGATNATPWLRMFGPTGALIAESVAGNTLARDGYLTLQATNAGTYLVVAAAAYAGQTGGYGIHLAQSLAPITVSPADDGGELQNGTEHTGFVQLGDLDVWSFTAQAGEGLFVRTGATNATPWLRMFGPTGALIAESVAGNTLARDGFLTLQATNAGTYLVVAAAAYAGQTGGYGIHLAQSLAPITVSPGDDGGELVNGTTQTGVIHLGDLEMWRFTATAGNGLFIRMGGTNFTPWLRLYGPTGDLVGETISGNTLARDGHLALQATNAGPYTLVSSAAYSGQSGTYALQFVRTPGDVTPPPGDEGGPLVNGLTNVANLHLGDLDAWSFFGTPGDSNVFRVTATGFTPWIRVHSPYGSLAGETISGNSLARSGAVSLNITNQGLYTVIVAATYPGQSGTYTFKQSRVPPDLEMPDSLALDESAVMSVPISAQDPDEPIKPLTFSLLSAPPGVTLTLASATNALLSWSTTEADGPSTNTVVASVTDVVNGKSFTRTNSFFLVIHEVNTPPVLTVPADQTIDELTSLNLSVTATDADLPANPLRFSLLSPPDGMAIDPVSGGITWTPTEVQGPSSQRIVVVVTDDSPSAINEPSLSTTNEFQVVVREVNVPPVLAPIANRSIDELTLFTTLVVATDADLPPNPIAFRLLTAPPGMVIGPGSGAILWTPSEAQGPTTQLVTVVVTDNSPAAASTPQWSVTNAFEIVVREVNAPPVLVLPGDRSTVELVASTATVTATDADLPADKLTFQLLSPRTGMTIHPDSGVIAWTTTEADGPSTNRITVVVSETGFGDPQAPRFSITNSFQWIVTEENVAPSLQPIDDVSLHYGVPLAIQASASDRDLPANTLMYSLDPAPAGMTVDASSGSITWTPSQSQVGSHPVTVQVLDNGVPALSASQSFTVTVTGEGARLSISTLAGGLIQVSATGDVGVTYELQGSTDLIQWTKVIEFQSTASTYLYIDPSSLTVPAKNYRLLLK